MNGQLAVGENLKSWPIKIINFSAVCCTTDYIKILTGNRNLKLIPLVCYVQTYIQVPLKMDNNVRRCGKKSGRVLIATGR